MRHIFPLFQSHLDLSSTYWSKILQIGDSAIDATCGNGLDTLKLCLLTLSATKGKVYALDIQKEALDSTNDYLKAHLPLELRKRVEIYHCCHSIFPEEIPKQKIKLIVYNLGYLPKGNKALTTKEGTTLESLHSAMQYLQPGGVISITCYPGHEEGAKEEDSLLDYCSQLPPKEWSICHHRWLNRHKAPSLLLLQKSLSLSDNKVKDD